MPTSSRDPLAAFSPGVRAWFEASYAAPTAAQELAWPAIASGEHVLLAAPTGSGKTLAAFLWALDRLSADRADGEEGGPRPGGGGERASGKRGGGGENEVRASGGRSGAGGVRVLYVSPLKALSYDIERNLRAPLRGIGADVSAGIRTGDTSQAQRAAMARKPPDILITTPESLYLILGSRARTMLDAVETVIVDEIHAVASVKRGAHLALTLERLDAQVRAAGGGEPQRIGLSATQRPLEEVGRFLVGPHRKARILDAGARKQLDLRIEVPVESMAEPGPPADPLDPVPGSESTRNSIWPAIYPELLRLVREHRSTIVFVNNRRSAERVALRLNELAEAEIARAHHGSLSREERTLVEEQLKAGDLPCLVATSSLELGIDMGAVDLVVQVESPKSVARGLQRIGRAGHGVGDVSKGRLFPKFRGDLLECAVVCRRMREGEIEETVVVRNALDVLAQQIVAIAAAAEDGGRIGRAVARGEGENSGAGAAAEPGAATDDGSVSVDDLYELVTRTHSYAELPKALLENVLDMLDGRYPSSEFGELRARIVWDRVGGRIRARRGARQLAVANAGTIPDRGLYLVTLPDGRRVGELDEEMVYEARPGQVFLLGASSWRIEEIGRDRVIVTPAPGVPGAVPFWKGDGVGRPLELGRAIGEFSRWAVEQDEGTLAREYDLDERAARNLVEYLREQQAATQVMPSDRTIVLERFRDEIGDWRLCVLSPYGGRVHAAWGLAIAGRLRERHGVDGEVLWSDDGIVMRLPDVDLDAGEEIAGRGATLDADRVGAGGQNGTGREAWEAPALSSGDAGGRSYAELVAIDAEEVEEAIVSELGSSALFGARFRESAGRALLIPRAYPGRRTPLWQQRLKAQSLLEVARRYPDFPIVLETYRECLRDVLDLDGLKRLLRGLSTRELALVEVQTETASPFAGSLLFDYVATYMYEGDTPSAERRAAALSLDRELLRELLGQEELRELIDPGALRRVEDDLQRRSPLAQATSEDTLLDVLRAVGDLGAAELRERVLDGLDPERMLAALERERRAIKVRVGGEERAIAADDAGLYRDALGCPPPGGLPGAFVEDVPDALRVLVERWARTHGPFAGAQLQRRYGVDCSAILRELERDGRLVRGELRPEGSEREWCEVEVLRSLRRASLAALRREIEPVDARALAAFMPSWQGIDRHRRGPRTAAGVERLREAIFALQGLALPVQAWEQDVLPRRTGSYSPSWLDELCASGEVVWVGAGPLGRSSGKVALYFRDDAPLLGPPAGARGMAQDAQPQGGSAAQPQGGSAAQPLGGSVARPEGASAERREGTSAERREGEQDARALVRERLAAAPCFFADLLAEVDLPAAAIVQALWDLVWAGEASNDSWAPLRSAQTLRAVAGDARTGDRRALGPAGARVRGGARSARRIGGRSLRARRPSAGAPMQGRWSLTRALFAVRDGDPDRRERGRAWAELLLERYGVLTREQVAAEGLRGGFSALYGSLSELETLGVCRRGYFVEGLGGAQFALPGAVERLRASRTAAADAEPRTVVLAAVDPAQPYGAVLPWPRSAGARRPRRVAGAHVVLVDAEPVLYLERGGHGLLTLAANESGASRVRLALRAVADAVRAGSLAAVALERVDGESAIGSPLEPALVELGFRQGPRRLTLRA